MPTTEQERAARAQSRNNRLQEKPLVDPVGDLPVGVESQGHTNSRGAVAPMSTNSQSSAPVKTTAKTGSKKKTSQVFFFSSTESKLITYTHYKREAESGMAECVCVGGGGGVRGSSMIVMNSQRPYRAA